MKNRILSTVLVLVMVFLMLPLSAINVSAEEAVQATPTWDGSVSQSLSGSGTQADPYRIYNGSDLAYVAQKVNAGTTFKGNYFSLMDNVDLNGKPWTPIGHNGSSFSASFNGNGFAISNLSVTGTMQCGGLFGYVSGANISNLAIIGATVNTVYDADPAYGGVLAGRLLSTKVSQVYVNGSVTVLSNRTAPSYCVKAGMIAGELDSGSSITNSFGVGDVFGTMSQTWNVYIGGLVGSNSGSISYSYFNGSVTGNAPQDICIGGISGTASGYTSHSFAVATIKAITPLAATVTYVSPIVPSTRYGSPSSRTNCYYNVTSNVTLTQDGTYYAELTSLQSSEYIKNQMSFDFNNVWYFDTSDGYLFPKLRGVSFGSGAENLPPEEEPPVPEQPEVEYSVWDGSISRSLSGSGTKADPYLIYSGADLAYLAQNAIGTSKYASLMNNIDLAGISWSPIGTKDSPFKGIFDGNGYTIKNLSVTGNKQYSGLFGYTSAARVSNLAICLATVNVTYDEGPVYGGALVGFAEKTSVERVYVNGNVNVLSNRTGDNLSVSAGMIMGCMSTDTSMQKCFATGSVTGTMTRDWNAYIGGLAGYAASTGNTIDKCYFNGNVTANGYEESCAGGLVGIGSPSASNCFAVGTVSAKGGKLYASALHAGARGTLTNSNCYYNVTLCKGASSTTSSNTLLSNLQNRQWLGTSLGFDFSADWYMDASDNYVYPKLQGVGFGNGQSPAPHEHSYTETVVVEPTCDTDGYTLHKCSCGNSYQDAVVKKLGHVITEYTVVTEPTCESAGRKVATCLTCNQVLENLYIPALGHKYVSTVTKEVTCTTPGILTHICQNCEDSYVTYVYSEHEYAIVEHVDATCEADGYNRYTCKKCEDTYDEVIEGGHDYESVITKIATKDEDGLMTYTCVHCQHSYTEVIPARPDANVLLVQDRQPWGESTNTALLTKMQADGYITGWDLTTTAGFGNINLASYNVILIANDQSTATYEQLKMLNDALVEFATAGGVVIYGACDHGWAGGNINYSLPEGVVKKNFYSNYNYIVDQNHFIVSGILTDGKALTNNLLYGNYCSHTAFDKNSLPDNANVILQDGHGDPTLVEYGVGNGHVILSGLTWEFYYTRSAYGGGSSTFTKNVYDDLIAYGLYLSDPCEHAYDEGTVVAPTCCDDGYTLHECAICGATMKDTVVPALGHAEGEWVTVTEATELSDGLRELRCPVCELALSSEVIPALSAPVAKVESVLDAVVIGDQIVFTLTLESCPDISSITVTPVWNTDLFLGVSGVWMVEGAEFTVTDGTLACTATFASLTSVNTAVYTLTLSATSVIDYATVSFTVVVNDGTSDATITVVPKTVAILECPHTSVHFDILDASYHAVVCDKCGYTTMTTHSYDDVCDADCNDCAAERTPPHSFAGDYTYDENGHKQCCEFCHVEGEMCEHEYDASLTDIDCNACGYVRYARGDVNLDGTVDTNDAIYLTYYIFFGNEDYPIYMDADFNADGIVTTEDSVYLLYHVLFGAEEYPL